MKLSKAIELILENRVQLKTSYDHDLFEAILLGSEALEWIEQARSNLHGLYPKPLPSETEN